MSFSRKFLSDASTAGPGAGIGGVWDCRKGRKEAVSPGRTGQRDPRAGILVARAWHTGCERSAEPGLLFPPASVVFSQRGVQRGLPLPTLPPQGFLVQVIESFLALQGVG